MPERLIITGASGFVAGSVVCQAGADWEVHALSRKPAPVDLPHVQWHTLDIMEFPHLGEVFRQVQPSAVIHAAGVADVDWCEQHPAEAQRINIDLTREVAWLCQAGGARLVYTSTDTVFRGDRGMYVESDPPDPVNFYGRTKWRGEQAVSEELGGFVIARLAIVMGFPFLGGGHSSLARLIEVLESGRDAPVAAEEIRTPIDVVTLGRALLELAVGRYQGIIHLSGNERLTRLEFSRRMAERLGYPPSRVTPISAAALAGRAPRPADVSLDNARARTVLKTPMRGLLDGLDLILSTPRPQPGSPGQ